LQGDRLPVSTCRNRPVATLSAIADNSSHGGTLNFLDRTAFRKNMSIAQISSVQLVREMRDEE